MGCFCSLCIPVMNADIRYSSQVLFLVLFSEREIRRQAVVWRPVLVMIFPRREIEVSPLIIL